MSRLPKEASVDDAYCEYFRRQLDGVSDLDDVLREIDCARVGASHRREPTRSATIDREARGCARRDTEGLEEAHPMGAAMLCFGGLIVLLVLLVAAAIALYNRLIVLRNRVDNAWSQIDVQLQAPLRPDPEPRRDGQGLRHSRDRDVREGDPGAQHGHQRSEL